MRKAVCTMLFILAIALVLGSASAVAQNVGDNSVFFVSYYSNANTVGVPDAVLRVVNDGSAGGNDLCANIYVFDDSQELQECCSCQLSADGLLSESVNRNLTANSLTGFVNHRGVIKVISTAVTASGCFADTKSGATTAGNRGWLTHIQRTVANPPSGASYVTETALADSNLGTGEASGLETLCGFAEILGSGHGRCSCTPEDVGADF